MPKSKKESQFESDDLPDYQDVISRYPEQQAKDDEALIASFKPAKGKQRIPLKQKTANN